MELTALGVLWGGLSSSAFAARNPEEPVASAFARDMLGKVGDERSDENFVFSPFSVVTAFGMTYAGARSDTAAEMEQVFHFPGPETTHSALADLAATVEDSVTGENTVLRLANRIWLQKDWPAEEAFLNILVEEYGAPLETADFKTQPDAERTAINDWVYDRTWERIEDLLPAGSLNSLTCFVLVNALYFRAPWKHPFNPDATTDADFQLPSGETATVRMMHGEHGDVPYIEREKARAIALPVEDGDFSFVLVVPKPDASLEDVRTAVTEGAFALDYDGWNRHHISVFLPRFRVEAELDLKALLQGMGITDAFDPDRADFTGIHTGPEPNLHLTAARHKAFIEVIETGLEAAAASAVVGSPTSIPPQFRADRPFLFFIAEDTTGAVLFSGQVIHPENPPEDPAGTAGENETYNDWLGDHFSGQEPAAPGSDPGGTGIPILLRYAFALDPHRPDRAALPSAEAAVPEGDGEAYLTLTYTRKADTSDLDYRVQASDDLTAWETLGDDLIVSESVGDTAETVTVRDSKPIGETERRYLRVRVSLENE